MLTTRPVWSPTLDATLGADVPPGTVVIRAPRSRFSSSSGDCTAFCAARVYRRRATSYIGWPDEMAGWVPAATWHALRAVRRYRPDVLYSTSSPVSAHLVALIVSRISGHPVGGRFPRRLDP